MAFTTPPSAAGVVAPRRQAAVCETRRRAATSRVHTQRHRAGVHASYATDLQQRTSSVTAASTDAVLARAQAAVANNDVLPTALMQEMVVHLADTRGMARLNLVNTFGKIGSVAAGVLLEGLRTCPNPVVRRSCGKALAQLAYPDSVPDLVNAMLHDDDRVARASAAGALARVGRPAIPALLAVLAGSDANMGAKGHAAWALAFMQADAADALLEVAHHPAADVRLAVVSALGAALLGDSLPVMSDANEVMADSNEQLDAVDPVVAERCLRTLTNALTDEAGTVRAEAVSALANGGRRSHVPDIVRLLDDNDAEVRRACALALMKLGDVSVLPALRRRVEDADENEDVQSVVRLALRALERIEEGESDWDE